MKCYPISRRMFLQGLGATLAIPFLPSLAHAQAGNDPLFIYFAFNQGHPRNRIWPWNKTVPFTQTDDKTKIRRLRDIIAADGKISSFFGPEWNSYADSLNIITHLNMFGTSFDHNPYIGGAATANWKHPIYTLDHCIKEAWAKRGYNGKVPLLAVNIGREQLSAVYGALSSGMTKGSKVGQPYPTIENVQKLALTLTGVAPGGGAAPNGDLKLVDAVLEDYKNIQNSRRISSLDRKRLSDAMDLWNDIQNRLQSSQPQGQCSIPSGGTVTNLGEQNRLATDMIIAALSCGLTRVVSHQMVHVADQYVGAEAIHNMAHGGGPWLDGFTWRFKFLKEYADKLSSITDANGQPLLKRTVLFNATEYTDYGNHELLGRGVITLGDGGGRLKTGYHVHGGGAPFQRAHITVMKALGLSQADIEIAGTPGFGEYKLHNQEYTEDGMWRFGYTSKEDGIFRISDAAKYQSDAEKRKHLVGLI